MNGAGRTAAGGSFPARSEASERTLPDGEKVSLFGPDLGSPRLLVISLTSVQFQRLMGLMTRHMGMARRLLYG